MLILSHFMVADLRLRDMEQNEMDVQIFDENRTNKLCLYVEKFLWLKKDLSFSHDGIYWVFPCLIICFRSGSYDDGGNRVIGKIITEILFSDSKINVL